MSSINESVEELPFVDRENECARVKLLLRNASDGQGRLVFVSGEAGIGKTRFAHEMASFAKGSGFQCLRAKCARGPGAPSYALWIDLIRQFSEEVPTRRFFKACGANLEQIVRLVPELSESSGTRFPNSVAAPPLPQKTPEEVQLEEIRFFHALTQFFFRVAEESPLMLILDDLQWCDPASLGLLRFFFASNDFRKLPILFLCLHRDLELEAGENPILSNLISDLQRERRIDSIHLQRLDSENVARLIERVLSRKGASEELRDLVYSRTGGNPLFVEEVLRCLIEQGAIFGKDGEEKTRTTTSFSKIFVPETIKNIIKQRLHYLDEATVDLLRTASVIGEQFSYSVLQQIVSPLPGGDHILKSLEKALKTGLILERESSLGESYYLFSDESVRDVLYDQVSLARRQHYHIMAARSLEAQYVGEGEDSIKEHAAEVAHHYLEGGDPNKAREYFNKAAKRASELYAHSIAFAHYKSALELLDNSEKESDEKQRLSLRAQLLESMGDECQFLPEYEKVFECWNKAAPLYESSGELRRAANVYVKISMAYHLVMYELDKSESALEKAVLLAKNDKDVSSAELARLTAYSMISDIWKGDREKVKERTALARKLAKESGAYDVLAMTSSYGVATNLVGEIDESIESCNSGLKIALEHGFTLEVAFCHFHRAASYAYTHGPSRRSLELFLEGLDFTNRTNYFMANLFHKVELAYGVYLPLGEWAKAREMAEDALKSIRAFPPNSLFNLIASSAMGHVLLHEGDLDKAEEYLEHVKQVTRGFGILQLDVPLYIALARVNIGKRDFVKAEMHLREGYRLSKQRGLTVVNGIPHVQLLSLMIEFCLLKEGSVGGSTDNDDGQFLDTTLAELLNASKEIKEEWPLAYCLRSEGLIAGKRKQIERAVALLQDSISIFEKLGWPYEAAKTQQQLGALHLQSGDALSAMKIFDSAIETFFKLGAKPDLANASSLEKKARALRRQMKTLRWKPKLQSGQAKLVFENLAREFVDDYVSKKLDPEKCGWRSLSELSRTLKLSKHDFYGKGPILRELLESGGIETRKFSGERGRGGEVTKIRVDYHKPEVKTYVDRMIAVNQ